MALHAIILSGGHGTRLWPSSRPSRPKQFLPLMGERSMFQSTVLRMEVATGDRAPIVIAGEGHAADIQRQLDALGEHRAAVLIEPEARDSAAAIAAGAAWIARTDPEGIGVMVASDHHLPDLQAFADAVAQAAEAAAKGAIVTFGVKPRTPSEAYGYIQPGAPLGGSSALKVERFAEKPDADTARRYLADGWFWNSGNFVFRAATLLEEMDRHAPEIAAAARASVEGVGEGPGLHRLSAAFRRAPKISFDYALMEKTDKAAVVPLDAEWSDLGAWDAVHAASEQDAHGNAAPEGALLHGARNSLVRASTGQVVAMLDVEDVAVIVEADAVLVARLGAAQGVKQIVDRLRAEGRSQAHGPAAASPAARLKAHAREWGLWMRASALPLWQAVGADREQRAWVETLSLDAEPTGSFRRLRVQGRQTYVYALAGSRGWAGPWREAVELGLDSLKRWHRKPDGGYRTKVSSDGAPADETVMLYDLAFVLLALCWARSTGVAPEAEAEALSVLDRAIQPRANPNGGFRESDDRRPWQSNPHMHLFEAAMAWAEAGGDGRWGALADEIATLALTRFIDADGGYLREFFDDRWAPAAGEDGRVVEPGHQFEWAWLLDRWAERKGSADAARAARRLYAIGASKGVDADLGVALNSLDDALEATDPGARLWPQTERLKAALRLADRSEGRERDRLLLDAADAADGLKRYLEGVAPGLWRDKLQPGGAWVDEPAPASSLYHIACAVAELEDRARGLADG